MASFFTVWVALNTLFSFLCSASALPPSGSQPAQALETTNGTFANATQTLGRQAWNCYPPKKGIPRTFVPDCRASYYAFFAFTSTRRRWMMSKDSTIAFGPGQILVPKTWQHGSCELVLDTSVSSEEATTVTTAQLQALATTIMHNCLAWPSYDSGGKGSIPGVPFGNAIIRVKEIVASSSSPSLEQAISK